MRSLLRSADRERPTAVARSDRDARAGAARAAGPRKGSVWRSTPPLAANPCGQVAGPEVPLKRVSGALSVLVTGSLANIRDSWRVPATPRVFLGKQLVLPLGIIAAVDHKTERPARLHTRPGQGRPFLRVARPGRVRQLPGASAGLLLGGRA
jgi:hypothetical protein